MSEIASTIVGVGAGPTWLSLKNDLHVPDDATIVGLGSSSFGHASYGTLTLPGAATPIGARPSETVTQRIQAALDLAAGGPVGLLWDVRCSVGVQAVPGFSGDELLSALWLRRPGNLHVVGRPGCGAILRPQTNAAILAVESYSGQFGTAIANAGTDQQVNAIGNIAVSGLTFEGLYLNANSGVTAAGFGSSANQPSPPLGQVFYLNVMRLFGVQDVTFRGCTFVGGAGFHLYFGNWRRVRAEGCTLDSLGTGFNGTLLGGNDGFHLNGPGDDFTARDCSVAMEDDYIAINAADGNNWSGRNHGGGGVGSVPAWGAISNVRAYNLRSTRADTVGGGFVRVLACAGVASTGHVFEGLRGPIFGVANLDNSGLTGATGGSIGRVAFRDVDCDFARSILAGGGTSLAGIDRLTLAEFRRSGSHLAVPLVDVSCPVARLSLSGFDVQGTASNGSAVSIGSGGSVGLALVRASSCGGSGSLIHNAGTLGTLVASNIDPGCSVLTGSAAGSASGDYFGGAGPAPTGTTVLDETFTGTAGSALTGQPAAPGNHGLDVWATFSPYPALVYRAGGGATSATFSSSLALSVYPLSGVAQDQVVTVRFRPDAVTLNVVIQVHRSLDGANCLALTFSTVSSFINLTQVIGGSNSSLIQPSYGFTSGLTYTATVTTSGTTLSLDVSDGTTLTHAIVNRSFTAASGSALLLGQSSGAAGDLTFLEAKVAV